MKERIPVSGAQDPLQSPFAALDIRGLPEGPSQAEKKAMAPSTGRLVFRKEKAHRGGKSVIVISGFDPAFPVSAIEELAGRLKKQAGCGGTVRDREIEMQGDDPERFRQLVKSLT